MNLETSPGEPPSARSAQNCSDLIGLPPAGSDPARGAVVVIDDDEAFVESMVSLLATRGYSATGFHSPVDFLDAASGLSLDCLITDLRMPKVDGLRLIERMREMRDGKLPVIVVSGHATVPSAVAAMKLGAVTLLEKPFPPVRLLEAVASAIASVEPVMASSDGAATARYETLSRREREVLTHLVHGSSSKMTALALGISHRTVEIFRRNILRKMEARNIAAVATQMSGRLSGVARSPKSEDARRAVPAAPAPPSTSGR